MPFIGIISNEESENTIRHELLDRLNFRESSILFIKEKSIENIKNIRFETVILARKFNNEELLKKLLTNTKYLIVNSDIETNLSLLKDLELTVITYGFNSKATVTTSSNEEEEKLICIQRSIVKENGEIEEPQEIKVNSIDANISMIIVAVQLIYDENK